MYRLTFTTEEFDIMVEELLEQEPVSFQMLCDIAAKTLRPTVIRWCRTDENLRGRGYEEDILQEIYIRLIKTTVSYFLLRDGVDGPVNRDPQGFYSWMFKVATNIKRDFTAKLRQDDFKTDDLENAKELESDGTELDRIGYIDQIRRSVAIAINADVRVYKSVTWLAHCVFILQLGMSRNEANDMIEKAFEHKSLNDMYRAVASLASKITWLDFESLDTQRITDALGDTKDGVIMGEAEYGSFFMKKGGKKTISDWVNRMNNLIRRTMEDEASKY